MNTLRVEDLPVSSVLDRDAMATVDGGWGFSFVKKYAKRAYSIFKKPQNRVTAWKYAKTGYKYAKKAWNWIF